MIKIDAISANALKIHIPDKSQAGDFSQLAEQADSLIAQQGEIRLLIDASGFHGWENMAAFETHAGFVKSHQQRVERIAIIVGHEWQRWLIGMAKLFVHPEVRAYDAAQEAEAEQWITGIL